MDKPFNMKAMLDAMRAIPPAPQIYWTHLLTGRKAYQRAGRSYISIEALKELKEAPVNPYASGIMPAFGAVEILNAEDVARQSFSVMNDDFSPSVVKARAIARDLLEIANAEYGDKAGAALQMAFHRPKEKKDE